eukprot:m.270180 g.270180  ORF g.270180 m.270180 type:complete len:140 (-) comp16074_c1_seq3:1278-1697(-)
MRSVEIVLGLNHIRGAVEVAAFDHKVGAVDTDHRADVPPVGRGHWRRLPRMWCSNSHHIEHHTTTPDNNAVQVSLNTRCTQQSTKHARESRLRTMAPCPPTPTECGEAKSALARTVTFRISNPVVVLVTLITSLCAPET